MNFKQIEKKWQGRWAESGIYKADIKSKKALENKHYVLEMFAYPSGATLHWGHYFNYMLSDSYARFRGMAKNQNIEPSKQTADLKSQTNKTTTSKTPADAPTADLKNQTTKTTTSKTQPNTTAELKSQSNKLTTSKTPADAPSVFHPMGFDSFGLPAENYAIKNNVHPRVTTNRNIELAKKQIDEMGLSIDWEYEIITSEPDYYKWTQWLFLQLYKHNLAYRKEAPVNWCESCATVLANEQVVSGACERCESDVSKKNLTQWFFKITDYAEELLTGLDDKKYNLDWPEKTKLMQRNWIGKSEGVELEFKVCLVDSGDSGDSGTGSAKETKAVRATNSSAQTIKVFTTRIDTITGVNALILAPEHEMVAGLVSEKQKAEVVKYLEQTAKLSEIDRQDTSKEKTGVFIGAYALNPYNNIRVPIYIADYILAGYGTGAVMSVPEQDERDKAFAKKFNLSVPKVESVDTSKLGVKKINYRLRDWLVSRQRYWGTPIPIVYCDLCGIVPLSEKDLPVLLPDDVEFKAGTNPLENSDTFKNTTCPKCKKSAKRETDTLDTFVCSSWYFLRYPSAKNNKAPFCKTLTNKLLPVDVYVGGAEHAVMHLLYARFITKALRDMGHLNFGEPFKRLIHQGIILGSDGNKMSKSKNNFIPPQILLDKYGADVFRLNLMFAYDFTVGGAVAESGLSAMSKFLEKIERLVNMVADVAETNTADKVGAKASTVTDKAAEKELNFERHRVIDAVTKDIPNFAFNTSIARMFEIINTINKHKDKVSAGLLKDTVTDLVVMLAPLTPHFAEEMWERLQVNQAKGGARQTKGGTKQAKSSKQQSKDLGSEIWDKKNSVHAQTFPLADKAALVKDETELAVQVNNKIKGKIIVSTSATKEEIKQSALALVAPEIKEADVKNVIVIPNRLVNIVV
ncbi:MAG: leucine--tRNA ligase [Firmicutes bacterium]|nr:leucine--tRNA ligase [Bacillota bacterium]